MEAPALGMRQGTIISTINCRLVNCATADEKLTRQGQHAVNLLLHACATVMLLGLTKELLSMFFADEARIVNIAQLTTVIFAVHPIHTECVGQKESKVHFFRSVTLLAEVSCSVQFSSSSRFDCIKMRDFIFCHC